MGRDLKSENLAVCIPNKGCDRRCPYCISRMTGYVDSNFDLMRRNRQKVIKLAERAEATSVLITGKGEPLMNMEATLRIASWFRDWPLELQTNGVALTEEPDLLRDLKHVGFNVIAISVDRRSQIDDPCSDLVANLCEWLNKDGFVVRLTINMTDMLDKMDEPILADEVLAFCRDHGVGQLTFRRIAVPERHQSPQTANWIYKHAYGEGAFHDFVEHAKAAWTKSCKLIRTLRHGVTIYDMDGVGVSFSDYCIQEKDHGLDLRSLIFMEDGHLYTKWDAPGSIIL